MKLIILDRDGVINFDSVNYIRSPDDWRAIPGSLEAIARLNSSGYQVAIATNQSGISRGYYSKHTLEEIHQKMRDELAKVGGEITAIFYCPHLPEKNCDCRKPKTGLLNQISAHFNCSLEGVVMIGDRLSDVRAARAAGATPYLVQSDFLESSSELNDVLAFTDLENAVDFILSLPA